MYMTNFKGFYHTTNTTTFNIFSQKNWLRCETFIITCEFNKLHECETKNIEADSFSQNVQKMEDITIYNIILGVYLKIYYQDTTSGQVNRT